MKNTVIAAIVALVIGLAAGFGIASMSGGPKAPKVLASASEGSLDQVVKDTETQLAAVEEQFKQIKRTPKLEGEKFQFNTVGAASEGPENAKINLVVFSDFECPFCKRFGEATKLMRLKFPNDVRVTFMNFPLDMACNSAIQRPFHQRACMGSMAASYAQDKGKFWEMHDWLFANQQSYSPESIAAQATSMGLSGASVQDAISTLKYKDRMEQQAQQLLPTGKRGTPTVFINGQLASNVRWDDPQAVNDFINSLLTPQAEEKPKLEPSVKDPASLPAAQVILPNGVTLEAWMKDVQGRIAALQLPPSGQPGPGQQPQKTGPDPAKVYAFDNTKSPALGPENAKVTMVVFSDFLCPHCFRVAGVVAELHRQFPNDLRIVWKNVPAHQTSPAAHEAAMEAFAQGKFWEMHDIIFKNRQSLTADSYKQFAQQLGLNMEQFNAAMADQRHREELKRDLAEADKGDVRGTPTVFINGRHAMNSDTQVMAQVIQTIISGGQAPAGAPVPPPAQPMPGGPAPQVAIPAPPPASAGAPTPAPVPPTGGGR